MALARTSPHPHSTLTTVELSVAIRRPLAVAVPGRTLENAYTRVGNVAERQANKLAHAFGMGPLAVHEHIEKLMGMGDERDARLEEINKKPPEKLQRYCNRLLEHAFPTKSAVTQMDCFKCIVSLITRYAGFRAIFLGCPRLGRANPTSDELVQLWGRSDAFGTLQDFTFDLGGPLWKLDVDQFGLNVIEQLIVSSGCEGTSKYSASLAIRYLGGIVACLSFWLQDGPVFDTTVTKLLVAADGLLKDLGIDSNLAAEEASPVDSDVEGIDLLCEAIVAGVLWRASHRAPDRIVSSEHDWMNGFTKFVTLLRHPCAESTLPFAWERATSEDWNQLQPVSYSLKEFKIFRQESLESPIDPAPTPLADDPARAMLVRSRVAALTPKLTALVATKALENHRALVRHMQFSPDGNYLATTSLDWMSILWRVNRYSLSLHRVLPHNDRFASQAAWSENGKMVLTRQLQSVRLWDEHGACQGIFDRPNNIESITWFPGSQAFLSVENHTITKLDLRGNVVGQYDFGRMNLRDVAVTPDGVRLLAIGASLESRTGLRLNKSPADKLIAVYNTETKQIEHQMPVLDDVQAITLAKNTEQGVVALAPPQLWKMDLVKDRKNPNLLVAKLSLRNTYKPEQIVGFAGPSYFGGKNDELVLCAGKAGDIHIWDQESGTLLRHIRTQAAQTGDLTCIAWNNAADDPLMFATGSHDGAVRIWMPPPASEHQAPEPEPAADNEPLPPQTALGVDDGLSSGTDPTPELEVPERSRGVTESANEGVNHAIISPTSTCPCHHQLKRLSSSAMSERRQSVRLSVAKAQKGASTSKAAPARAKSGTSNKAAVVKESIRDDDWDDFDDEDEDEEMDSGSDVEYGKRRPAKKQKLNNSEKRGGKTRSAGKNKNECSLVEMPLDILFEILRRCPSQDLISLSRTSHLFRSHLLSQASSGIWKAAREYADGPPVGPGMSEQQWAHLIFGKARCQSCGAPNVQRVDFGLQRRTCTACLKENLVITSRFKSVFPDIERSILDLLRYTNIGGHANGHASHSRWYWHDDIVDMVRELESLERDVHVRVPGAFKKKEAFIADRKELIVAIVKASDHRQHSFDCTANCVNSTPRYALNGPRTLSTVVMKNGTKYRASDLTSTFSLKAKFLELGYVEADINAIRYQKGAEQATLLTERSWKLVRSPLEEKIKAAKASRLRSERHALVRRRRNVAEGLYNTYKRSLVPTQWRSLPRSRVVLAEPAFNDIIAAADDREVTEAHFQAAVDSLPEMILSLQAARSAHLLELIQAPHTAAAPTDAEPGEVLPSPPHPHSLDSALAVFICERKCTAGTSRWSSSTIATYVGQEAAAAHHCHLWYDWQQHEAGKTVFQLSPRGVQAAAALLESAGLDNSATCAQMDALDARFLCKACSPRKSGSNFTYSAYPWRAAITHFEHAHWHESLGIVPKWELLDPARMESVKTTETDSTLSWACNHCVQHMNQCETRAKVAEHVEMMHGISNPAVGVDLFRLLDLEQAPATLYIPKEAVPPPNLKAEYNCLQCAGEKPSARTRLFLLDGVKSHLKAKHQVASPVEGRDWGKAPNLKA
ncbi:Catabolite degradation [Mycena chlorophos]|uniref:Catabolite degradation n=1 Tax=Mycena chlorophos TaxID=658473 RepID=A0A8H6TL94_MYCCL|nr:Catabolite degradation [Mycena chlorophos]